MLTHIALSLIMLVFVTNFYNNDEISGCYIFVYKISDKLQYVVQWLSTAIIVVLIVSTESTRNVQ
jgi:hypothetical protein